MKKLITVVISLTLALSILYVQAQLSKKEEFMSMRKVCKRWGKLPLNITEFKAAKNEPLRAKMTCSLLKNQKRYIGMDIKKIREMFGEPSGHYVNEMIPTYLIQKTKSQDSWQIVFLIDKKKKVSKIVIHKNCCYI